MPKNNKRQSESHERSSQQSGANNIFDRLSSELDINKIPQDSSGNPTEQDVATVRRALISLTVLRELSNAAALVLTTEQSFPVNPQTIWLKVWGWIQYFHRNCIVLQRYNTSIQESAVLEIARSVRLLAGEETTRKSMISTPGFIDVLTYLWLEEKGFRDKIPRFKVEAHEQMFSDTIVKLFSADYDENIRISTVIVKGAGGSYDNLISYILKYLNSILNEPTPDFSLLRSLVGAITMLITTDDQLYWTCIWKRAAFSIAELSLTLSTHHLLADLHVPSIICLCHSFFRSAHVFMYTSLWASQALEGGILQASLLSTALLLNQPTHPLVEEAVGTLKRLGQYLVSRSVLRSLRRPLQELEESNFSQENVPGPLWDVFMLFKKTAAERFSVLDICNRIGINKASPKCDFSVCPRKIDGSYKDYKVMRCAGCYNVYYCSKECQRNGWQEHRWECKIVQSKIQTPQTHPRMASQDLPYFLCLTHHDFHKYQDLILELMLATSEKHGKGFTAAQISYFVIVFDYQAFPMTVTVEEELIYKDFSIASPGFGGWGFDLHRPRSLPKTCPTVEDAVKEATESMGKKVVTQVRTPVLGAFWYEVRTSAITLPEYFIKCFQQRLSTAPEN